MTEVSDPTKEERRAARRAARQAEREERQAGIIRELRLLDEDGLNHRFEESQSEIDRHREIRNSLNEKGRGYLESRNEFNRQVSELTQANLAQKVRRNEVNSEVVNLKKKRSEIVREMRVESGERREALVDAQSDAHKSVERAVARAQDAHDQMKRGEKEVGRLRDKANSAHLAWKAAKSEADEHHEQYVHNLLVYKGIKVLRKEIKNIED